MTCSRLLAGAIGIALVACAPDGGLQAADITNAPSMVEFAPSKWCRNRSGPMVSVGAQTQVQEWCDPGNTDSLQVDIFVKTANGDPGDYIVSYKNYPCNPSPPTEPPPWRVRDRLC